MIIWFLALKCHSFMGDHTLLQLMLVKLLLIIMPSQNLKLIELVSHAHNKYCLGSEDCVLHYLFLKGEILIL